MSLHLVPLDDERKHEPEDQIDAMNYGGAKYGSFTDIEGLECWCRPRIEWQDPETGEIYPGGPLVIHNAADCRELIERAEVIIAEEHPLG